MDEKRPRSRKKKVTEGSSSVFKREEANVQGKVGNPNRTDQNIPNNPSTGGRKTRVVRGGAASGIGVVILIIVLIRLFSGSCSVSSNNSVSSESVPSVAESVSNSLGNTDSSVSNLLNSILLGSDEVSPDMDTSIVNNMINNTPISQTQSELNQPAPEAAANVSAVSNKSRAKYTKIKGNGQDTFTIMVYMCGTDLESNYGMATNDLNEMLKATISDKVNLIVETGGCKNWQNSIISNKTNQRYKITTRGLIALDQNLGKRAMTDPETLSDFISYCKKNFPADRYALIMWDHGGGSLSGYGYDQLYISKGAMPLDQFYSALKKANCKFDFIGFDACLMATLETAVAAEPYADYLIGSEETEPGIGWYYTNWLTKLSANTSMNTVDLGKIIIDDFVTMCSKQCPSDKTTLSITDLAEFAGTVPEALSDFSKTVSSLVDSDNYRTLANVRAKTREFASDQRLNQIDIIDFANKVQTNEAAVLSKTLSNCIKYNRTSRSMTNAYGLSVYFPYQNVNGVNKLLSIYDSIGMNSDYGSAVKSFASILTGGQAVPNQYGYSGTGSLLGSILGSYGGNSYGFDSGSSGGSLDMTDLLSAFLGSSDFSSLMGDRSWIDKDLISRNCERISSNSIDPSNIKFSTVDGQRVLDLTDEEWASVNDIALNVFYDDGKGYIDLGLDNVFEYVGENDLLASYDGTWLALNGQIVPYYYVDTTVDGDSYLISGYIPAILNKGKDNEKQIEIMLQFDDQNPYGFIVGGRIVYSNGETDTVSRGLVALKDGDTLDFICDYYDYDGNYSTSYYFGNQFVINGPIEISNVKIENNTTKANFRLLDIYGNYFWTPSF